MREMGRRVLNSKKYEKNEMTPFTPTLNWKTRYSIRSSSVRYQNEPTIETMVQRIIYTRMM